MHNTLLLDLDMDFTYSFGNDACIANYKHEMGCPISMIFGGIIA